MEKLKLEIPEDFYKEEYRCDYLISNEMKKVWAVQLDLLNELLNVCKKHDLKIYASGGTLLGAIRHKGYIPWDDDIDLIMMRDDYDKLFKIGAEEFKYPYFFQNEETDPGSSHKHIQIRNSSTTGTMLCDKGKFEFNEGIFVDIFPLDNYISDIEKAEKQKKDCEKKLKKIQNLNKLSYRFDKDDKSFKGIIRKILHPFANPIIRKLELTKKEMRKYTKLCTRFNDRETEFVKQFMWSLRAEPLRKDSFSDYKEVPFEFIKIPVPIGYDDILVRKYGDYMKLVKEDTSHGEIFFDTEKAYTEYIEK